MTERDIFLSALDRPAAARPAFVADRCGPDEPLRRRVEALLAAHGAAERFLEQPAAAAADTFSHHGPAGQPTGDHAPTDPEPDRVGEVLAGRYKLLERIGEGGMGSVWMAEQTEPVKRKVAVKLIRSGLDSRAVLARFEAERQALAVMDHPNIAWVLDGGQSADGRPFFVMELVKGVPITDFCDQRKLTPRQRLELFVPVCQAIQHAHQKGVIHRDIKPSNVLVALYDDKPVPKVIDFGVAKAAGQTLTDKTLHTGFGAVVGTPEYMSPEQASFNNLDIDTRSDVYSLGVLLYELLTGTTPVDRKSLKQAALLEVLRIVREVDAPRPSAKLSTAATLPSIAASRGTEPAKLTKQVRGELDWLVLKALEKDRGRRYESAAGLAADVGRYLAGEPVQAVPPSAGYRLRKWAKKHRGPVAAGVLVLLTLLAGVTASTLFAVRATRAEAEARASAADAERNAQAAERNAEEARKQRDLHWAEAERATAAEIDAKVMAYGLEVDLDLAAMKTDETVGLLRMARRANTLTTPSTTRQWVDPDGHKVEFHLGANPAVIDDLRGLTTAVTLAAGQTHALLLPPLWPDDAELLDTTDGPDGRTVLTRDKAGVVRVWDALGERPPLTLRQRDERAVLAGFSPDGRTLFTQDEDSIVRFWNPDGTFRARTPLRAARYVYPPGWDFQRLNFLAAGANQLLVGNRTVVVSSQQIKPTSNRYTRGPHGPDDLYDSTTGRRLTRLDRPGWNLDKISFSPDGKLLTAVEIPLAPDGRSELVTRSQVVVWAADTGRELFRVHVDNARGNVTISPGGRWLRVENRGQPKWRVWDTSTWSEVRLPFLDWPGSELYFATDELMVRGDISAVDICTLDAVHRLGGATLSLQQVMDFERFPKARTSGELLLYGFGLLLDGRTLKRLTPPSGRRFHPRLAEAAGGRFLKLTEDSVVDTRTEKLFDNHGGAFSGWPVRAVFPGAELASRIDYAVRLTPKPDRLAIPPALLELWAQVAARGQLGPDGEFVKWDEPTWQRKREELAAAKPPYPDFPFPGHLARDPLHWLRKEFEAAADAARLPLAHELHRRAVALGDRPEAARWQREIDRRTRETAPPPRAKK